MQSAHSDGGFCSIGNAVSYSRKRSAHPGGGFCIMGQHRFPWYKKDRACQKPAALPFSQFKHISAANIILAPDAKRRAAFVYKMNIQIKQRFSQRNPQPLSLFRIGPGDLQRPVGRTRRTVPGNPRYGFKQRTVRQIRRH